METQTSKSEDRIQQECVIWFRNNHLEIRNLLFSVPNGGYRNPREAKKMKDTGTVSGVSDLILMYDGKTTLIEMKTPKGRQSSTQIAWQKDVEKQGFQYFVCYGLEDFKKVINSIIS